MGKAEDAGNAPKSFKTKGLIAVDSLGMMPLCLTIVLGLIIGLIKIPLPGGKFMKEPHTEVTALCQEESCP